MQDSFDNLMIVIPKVIQNILVNMISYKHMLLFIKMTKMVKWF